MNWNASLGRSLPWFRLGTAVVLVALGAAAGLASRCDDDMPGTGFVYLALLLAVQGTMTVGSFGTSLLACARREWRRASVEALVGAGMLLAIPLGLLALVSLLPGCRE